MPVDEVVLVVTMQTDRASRVRVESGEVDLGPLLREHAHVNASPRHFEPGVWVLPTTEVSLLCEALEVIGHQVVVEDRRPADAPRTLPARRKRRRGASR